MTSLKKTTYIYNKEPFKCGRNILNHHTQGWTTVWFLFSVKMLVKVWVYEYVFVRARSQIRPLSTAVH